MLAKRKRTRRSRAVTPGIVLVRQILVGVALIAFLALVGTAIWFGTRISALTIDTVRVSGGETVPADDVRMIAEAELQGAYFALVPRRFAWFYPEERIEASVRGIERINKASVDRRRTEIEITFSEYQPAFLWCGNAECLFVDTSGYAFETAPLLTGNSFVRYVDPSREPAIGEHAFSAEKALKLESMRSALATHRGFLVTHVEQSAPEELTLRLAEGGALKVSERMPVEEVLANLETVLTSDAFAHLANGAFEYIDLRYGDRVFVNEFGDDTATTSSAE